MKTLLWLVQWFTSRADGPPLFPLEMGKLNSLSLKRNQNAFVDKGNNVTAYKQTSKESHSEPAQSSNEVLSQRSIIM
jgi:hypothetical protein